ncbi:Hypothetical predicted protein, partial [Podarcis lilfordi]
YEKQIEIKVHALNPITGPVCVECISMLKLSVTTQKWTLLPQGGSGNDQSIHQTSFHI